MTRIKTSCRCTAASRWAESSASSRSAASSSICEATTAGATTAGATTAGATRPARPRPAAEQAEAPDRRQLYTRSAYGHADIERTVVQAGRHDKSPFESDFSPIPIHSYPTPAPLGAARRMSPGPVPERPLVGPRASVVGRDRGRRDVDFQPRRRIGGGRRSKSKLSEKSLNLAFQSPNFRKNH